MYFDIIQLKNDCIDYINSNLSDNIFFKIFSFFHLFSDIEIYNYFFMINAYIQKYCENKSEINNCIFI